MFYSVANGRTTGVFASWDLYTESVNGYQGAVWYYWKTLEEATQHLNRHGIQNHDINVHTDEKLIPLLKYCDQETLLVPTEVPYEHQKQFSLGGRDFVRIGKTNDGVHLDIHCLNFMNGLPSVLTLGWDQWIVLLSLQQTLKNSFARLKVGDPIHISESLGGGYYVSINTPYILFNIRQWYDGVTRPMLLGLTFRENQWSHLMNISHLLELSYQETLKEVDSD